MPLSQLKAEAADSDTAGVLHYLGDLYRRVEMTQNELASSLQLSATDLRALIYIGSETELTPKQVAEELAVTTGSVTPMIDRLERGGYVLRAPNPTDRRSTFLGLTPAGRHARDWAAGHYAKVVEQALGATDSVDVHGAAEFLAQLISAFEQHSVERA